jgi:hypothetical protein
MAETNGSEYGGVGGLISPLPHVLTAYEEARLMRVLDTYVPPGEEPVLASVEDARIAEAVREGRGSIVNPDGFTGGPAA